MKQVIETNLVQGAQILQDDPYPIRVDSVNRTAVLDERDNTRAGTAEEFGRETIPGS